MAHVYLIMRIINDQRFYRVSSGKATLSLKITIWRGCKSGSHWLSPAWSASDVQGDSSKYFWIPRGSCGPTPPSKGYRHFFPSFHFPLVVVVGEVKPTTTPTDKNNAALFLACCRFSRRRSLKVCPAREVHRYCPKEPTPIAAAASVECPPWFSRLWRRWWYSRYSGGTDCGFSESHS